MSAGRSRPAEYRRVGKRAMAAILLAIALWSAAAFARADHARTPGTLQAGNSWGVHAPLSTDGLSWG